MRAMLLDAPGRPLHCVELPRREPGPGQVEIAVSACGVCRTDLHVVDGDLTEGKLPIVPGHEIVGRVSRFGAGVSTFAIGQRVGVPWLGETCGRCNSTPRSCSRRSATWFRRRCARSPAVAAWCARAST